MAAIVNKRTFIPLLLAVSAGLANVAQAADPENCLLCHRYRGLSRINDQDRVELYYVDPQYYDHMLGPHARLRCTDCHPREEVEVIPHKPVSKVSCTKLCHLSETAETETLFSHRGMLNDLHQSVHNEEVLDKSNELLNSPLDEGQSNCLLCHAEPDFRWAGQTWAEQQANIERCKTCHTDGLPVNVRYYYWHVMARSRQARSHRVLTRDCALCHSNTDISAHFDTPNTVASYLESFHGKAMLLGGEDTAGCLDCHADELENVHLMLSKSNPSSPTHVDNVPDTCRSPACHPAAGRGISTAAIHLDLATSRGIEYFIAFIFVFLIVFTFGPSVILTLLELLQIAVGRQDPRHHRREEKAKQLMADPRTREKLKRFTPHQRFQHWVLFFSFTTLVITGFPLKFAEHDWAAWVINQIGNLHRTRLLHRIAGVVLLAGFVYHMVYVGVTFVRHKRRTGRSFFQSIMDMPMVMNLQDVKNLFHLLAYLLFLKKTRPQSGRFTLEEKFEYFGVFWGTFLLGVTGILLWANAWTTQYFTGRVLTIATVVHTFEAYLAFLHVGVIHMIGVIFSPAVFPVSPAMFTGNTPPEELAETHGEMLEEPVGAGTPYGKEVSHD